MSVFRSKSLEVQERGIAIAELTTPFMEIVVNLTANRLQQDIPNWNLSNKILLRYLGYVAGALDFADYVLNGNENTPRTETIAIDLVFYKFIEEALIQIPNAEIFLVKEKTSLESRLSGHNGPSLIGLLEQDLDFSSAFQLGADDFSNINEERKGWYPAGLFQLGLVGGGSSNSSGIKNGNIEGFSSNPNFYATAPDIKNGVALKTFIFDGHKAVLFFNCPMSNRNRLPWFLRIVSIKYKYVLAVCSEKSNQFDLMITHERMFFWSVYLGGFSSDSSHYNFGPIVNKISENVFVKRAFDEVEKLLGIDGIIYQETQ